MPVSNATFQHLVLEDDGRWELYCGRLVEKPGMTASHNDLAFYLGMQIANQVDRAAFRVRVNAGHIQHPPSSFYIPDVMVVPAQLVRSQLNRTDLIEVYSEPLPLVVEVWWRSTGSYDGTTKLPEYQRRGDRETWLLHPYERTLTRWIRQPDGTYIESAQAATGTVQVAALPEVTIDLDALLT